MQAKTTVDFTLAKDVWLYRSLKLVARVAAKLLLAPATKDRQVST